MFFGFVAEHKQEREGMDTTPEGDQVRAAVDAMVKGAEHLGELFGVVGQVLLDVVSKMWQAFAPIMEGVAWLVAPEVAGVPASDIRAITLEPGEIRLHMFNYRKVDMSYEAAMEEWLRLDAFVNRRLTLQ